MSAGAGGRWLVAAALAVALAGCAASPARPWPEAEALFHQEPRWLGGDAALSIDLGDGRRAWLFGDSFVSPEGSSGRLAARMVRNTLAVQSGSDPRHAHMEFAWGLAADGGPGDVFPAGDGQWFWPGGGFRRPGGPLVVFLFRMQATPGAGLGFATRGHAIAIIEDPDAPPSRWQPRVVDLAAAPFDAVPALAVVIDGPHAVALAIRQSGRHAGALVRYCAETLERGEDADPEWWLGGALGWVRQSTLGGATPAWVIDDAGAEASIHRDGRTGHYVHVASYGFGDTHIGVRTASALTGPWSPPALVYRPPESTAANPFVYAGKAHPGLAGLAPGELAVTYVANSFRFGDLLTPEGERALYWPRWVRIPRPPAAGQPPAQQASIRHHPPETATCAVAIPP